MGAADSRIPVTVDTRKLVKGMKRGGETYDDLLRKMVKQYEPPGVEADAEAVTGEA